MEENDAPSKGGAEEMIRPSQLLFGTIDSFGKPQGELQQEEANALAENYAAVLDKAAKESDQVATTDAQPETATQAKPAREFHLTADVLEMNHRDYIERTFWYWGFHPRSRSFAFGDLHGRGVPDGIADTYTEKPQQPWRIVQKYRDEIAARPTLREVGAREVNEEEIDEMISREQI